MAARFQRRRQLRAGLPGFADGGSSTSSGADRRAASAGGDCARPWRCGRRWRGRRLRGMEQSSYAPSSHSRDGF